MGSQVHQPLREVWGAWLPGSGLGNLTTRSRQWGVGLAKVTFSISQDQSQCCSCTLAVILWRPDIAIHLLAASSGPERTSAYLNRVQPFHQEPPPQPPPTHLMTKIASLPLPSQIDFSFHVPNKWMDSLHNDQAQSAGRNKRGIFCSHFMVQVVLIIVITITVTIFR